MPQPDTWHLLHGILLAMNDEILAIDGKAMRGFGSGVEVPESFTPRNIVLNLVCQVAIGKPDERAAKIQSRNLRVTIPIHIAWA